MKRRTLFVAMILLSFAAAPQGDCEGEPSKPAGTGGAGGGGGAGGEGGGGMICEPFSKVACYTGPAETRSVGDCADGFLICNALGTGYGFCEGEITPEPESCDRPGDENCDGKANEGCPP